MFRSPSDYVTNLLLSKYRVPRLKLRVELVRLVHFSLFNELESS